MTLLLGAHCSDGTALLSDGKSLITIMDSNSSARIADTIIGISGNGKPVQRLRDIAVTFLPRKTKQYDTFFISILSKNLLRINKEFSEPQDFIEALVALHLENTEKPALHHINRIGKASIITQTIGIGDGLGYAFPFLTQYYSPEISMKKFAELGMFIFEFIDDYFPEKKRRQDKHKRAIVFIPSNKKGIFLTEEEIAELERLANDRLSKYKQDFIINWI